MSSAHPPPPIPGLLFEELRSNSRPHKWVASTRPLKMAGRGVGSGEEEVVEKVLRADTLNCFMLSSKAGLRLRWRVEKGKFNSQGNTTNPLFQDEKPSQAFLSGFLLQPKPSWAKNSLSGKSLGKEDGGMGAGFHPGLMA